MQIKIGNKYKFNSQSRGYRKDRHNAIIKIVSIDTDDDLYWGEFDSGDKDTFYLDELVLTNNNFITFNPKNKPRV